MKKERKKSQTNERDVFVTIPTSLAGIFLAIVVLFLIFAKEKLDYLHSFIWGFVTLGIFALFFAYLTFKKKKK